VQFTNETDGDLVLPTLDPPCTLKPGDSIEIPDPVEPEAPPSDEDLAAMSVEAIQAFVAEHPDQIERVLAIEMANRHRKSVLALGTRE
jgi:hypothetical protein